jgi:ribosome-associated protein
MELSIARSPKPPSAQKSARKPARKPAAKPAAKAASKAAPPKAAPKAAKQSGKPAAADAAVVDGILALVERSLDDDQAEAITTIPLAGKSSMADYMVMASGRIPRQIDAMADHLATKLKAKGLRAVVEGLRTCEWVLIDSGDIIVHLFRPEIRTFYGLEKMWGMELPADLPGPSRTRVRA